MFQVVPSFTTYFLVVFPLRLDDPGYTPQPHGGRYKPTNHPRVFKVWRKFEWDEENSGYVEVTD